MKFDPVHWPLVVRRVVLGGVCVAAFMVMASVFSPERIRAGNLRDPLPGVPPKSIEYESADPHEGLRSLGTIQDRGLTVHIYATESGPRFTIMEKATGKAFGELLSEQQVDQAFPELQLPEIKFEGDSPLMIAEPKGEWQ